MSAGTRQQSTFDALKERVPSELIKTRQQGGSNISYVDWHTVADLLDERAPGWECTIKEVGSIGGKVYVRVAMTIEGVTRENIGYEDEEAKGYGDVYSNAFAMAYKRAASLFGVARHLYDKSDPARRQGGQQGQRYEQPRNNAPASRQAPAANPAPSAQSRSTDRGDLINGGQMNAIKNHCSRQGIDVDDFIEGQFPGRTLDQLTYQEGVRVISAWGKS